MFHALQATSSFEILAWQETTVNTKRVLAWEADSTDVSTMLIYMWLLDVRDNLVRISYLMNFYHEPVLFLQKRFELWYIGLTQATKLTYGMLLCQHFSMTCWFRLNCLGWCEEILNPVFKMFTVLVQHFEYITQLLCDESKIVIKMPNQIFQNVP